MVREGRERDCKSRSEDIIGISEEITDLGKDLDRDQEKAGTDGAAFVSAKDEVCRLTSQL